MSCFIYPVDNSKRSDSGLFQFLGLFAVNWEIGFILIAWSCEPVWTTVSLPWNVLRICESSTESSSVGEGTVSHPEFSMWPLLQSTGPYKGSLFLLWPSGYPFWQEGRLCWEPSSSRLLSSLWILRKLCYLWMSGPLQGTDGDFEGQMTCLETVL